MTSKQHATSMMQPLKVLTGLPLSPTPVTMMLYELEKTVILNLTPKTQMKYYCVDDVANDNMTVLKNRDDKFVTWDASDVSAER